jgi:dihydrofolate reductase
MLTGRRTFDKAHGWDGNHAWGPAFVLTHEIPDGWPRPNSTVHFVTDGVESAVRQAKAAAALLLGRVTYEMMEAGWRPVAQTGVRPEWMPEWMEPFARTIDATKKYVVSSTLNRVDWNAEFVHGDLGQVVQQLKAKSGKRARRECRRPADADDPLPRQAHRRAGQGNGDGKDSAAVGNTLTSRSARIRTTTRSSPVP